MRVYGIAIIILIAFSSISAWGDVKSKQEISSEAKSKAPHISSQQLAGYQSEKEDFVLLDIRTEAEFEAGHIRGGNGFLEGNWSITFKKS
jgi:hypothetical protein